MDDRPLTQRMPSDMLVEHYDRTLRARNRAMLRAVSEHLSEPEQREASNTLLAFECAREQIELAVAQQWRDPASGVEEAVR